MILQKANLLILDEPTNHLDPETQKMEEEGVPCETFSSSNIDGGEAINQAYLDRYKGQIHSL